jgi:hypothetical protein
VAARLEHQTVPDPIEPGHEVEAPRAHIVAVKKRCAPHNQPNRIARRVAIDAEKEVAHELNVQFSGPRPLG